MPFHIDSFRGALAELPKGRRTELDALRVLAEHPRVSAFDLSEAPWLHRLVRGMQRAGLIEQDRAEPYPWHRFNITDKGRAMLRGDAP